MKALERVEIGTVIDDMRCIEFKYHPLRKTSAYLMRCEKCGRFKIMLPRTLKERKGTTHKSCGQGLKTKNKRFYSEWQAMRTRTTNKNYEHYSDYGGRGISSEYFKYFIDFYDEMFSSYQEACSEYGEENVSLDRKDPNGNYDKSNCRWIHIKEQQGNTRRTVEFVIIFEDGTTKAFKNVNKTCKEYGWNPSCIKDLINGRIKSYKGLKGYRIENKSKV